MKIAFIGLGVMGYPMAGHQQKAGFDVCVYNRTTEKAQRWAEEHNGRFAPTPAEACEGAEVVMMCVGNDNDVRSVVYGEEGILAGLHAGAVLIDHTTTSRELALELAQACSKQDIHFLDGPVSGGQAGAENGALSIMVGGDEDVLKRVTPMIDPYAKAITYMGPSGAGQVTKMVNQILIAGVLQGISEGLTLAKKAGLDLSTVIDAISQGAAGSWQLSNRGQTISEDFFDYGFAIDWMVKDMGFCIDTAKALELPIPNSEYVLERYKELQAQGYNRADTSALIKQYD